MKVEKKHNSNFLFAILAFAATLFLLISLPMVSYAETGTLGAETPKVICTYEKDGVAVDGNSLTAGTYDVNFVLTGVKNLSVLEVTATYDESQVAVESTPDYLISDDALSGQEARVSFPEASHGSSRPSCARQKCICWPWTRSLYRRYILHRG